MTLAATFQAFGANGSFDLLHLVDRGKSIMFDAKHVYICNLTDAKTQNNQANRLQLVKCKTYKKDRKWCVKINSNGKNLVVNLPKRAKKKEGEKDNSDAPLIQPTSVFSRSAKEGKNERVVITIHSTILEDLCPLLGKTDTLYFLFFLLYL